MKKSALKNTFKAKPESDKEKNKAQREEDKKKRTIFTGTFGNSQNKYRKPVSRDIFRLLNRMTLPCYRKNANLKVKLKKEQVNDFLQSIPYL